MTHWDIAQYAKAALRAGAIGAAMGLSAFLGYLAAGVIY